MTLLVRERPRACTTCSGCRRCASIEGYYFKPRMDRELLQQLLRRASSRRPGARRGEVQTRLRLGQYDEAVKAAAEFRDIFGKENFFAEIMDHGLDIERRIMADLLRLAKELDLPLVAHQRPALHARARRDSATRPCSACSRARRSTTRTASSSTPTSSTSRPPPRCGTLFRDHPEACDNTLLIAERCDVEFNTSANYMPRFPVPEGETEETWFVKEVERGPRTSATRTASPTRCARRPTTRSASSRRWASPATSSSSPTSSTGRRRNGIRVGPGRGSGAGSMAAYAMGITDLDPLAHGLIFERFLNPDRVSMPDFDVDFDERRRGEVIRYVTEKYGDDRVAQIVTYGTIKAKQALKDSRARARLPVLGWARSSPRRCRPPIMGKDIPLVGHLRQGRTRATRRPATSAPSSRPTPRRRRSSRPRSASRT